MNLDEIMELVRASFDTGNTAQGLVIALIVAFMMSRYGQLIYYTVIAVLFDLLIVPVAIKIYQAEMNFNGAFDYTMEQVSVLSEDLSYAVIRLVFFVVAISILYGLKSILRRGS